MIPAYSNAYAKVKSVFLRFSSQGIGSSLISLEMIFQALHSEPFRFKFHSLSPKIPELNLDHNFYGNLPVKKQVKWSEEKSNNSKTNYISHN